MATASKKDFLANPKRIISCNVAPANLIATSLKALI
jgi:hypothetical protein